MPGQRGPTTRPAVRRLAIGVFVALARQNAWRAPTIEKVRDNLGPLLTKEGIRDDVPTEVALYKILAGPRRRLDDLRDSDKPWRFHESGEHDIPDEALGDLLQVWGRRRAKGEDLSLLEAKWIARLRHVEFIRKRRDDPPGYENRRDYVDTLSDWAVLYAEFERENLLEHLPPGAAIEALDWFLATEGKPPGWNAVEEPWISKALTLAKKEESDGQAKGSG